jgi:hypothetical protein
MKARAQAIPASRWSWLHRVSTAWVAVMLALILGILTFAVVREMSVECRREPSYVTTVSGVPITLVDGVSHLERVQKDIQCRFALGDRFVTFP